MPRYDESFYPSTDDGWTIALYRLRRGWPKRPAVLLCHGLGVGHRHLDIDERSLARDLVERGFDIWLVQLRGGGESRAPAGKEVSWSFDDHVDRDLPAALACIRDATGHDRVHFVGHSLGGTLGLAFATTPAGRSLGRMVALAAASRFDVIPQVRWLAERWGKNWPMADSRLLYRLFGALLGPVLPCPPSLVPAPVRMMIDPRNMEGSVARLVSEVMPTAVSAPLMRQISEWILEGSFRSLDGRDYWEGLGRVTQPVRLIAGETDELTPPASILPALDKLASAEKDAIVMGPSGGFSRAYGHGDLIFGIECQERVFPWVCEWLMRD